MVMLGKEDQSCIDGKINPKYDKKWNKDALETLLTLDVSDCLPVEEWNRFVHLRDCFVSWKTVDGFQQIEDNFFLSFLEWKAETNKNQFRP